MKPIAALFCLATLTAPALAQTPRTHAVLVGVGDYLYLDADLHGPPHDVALMAEALLARGVGAQDILTLGAADLPAGTDAGVPTRAAIMAALDSVAKRAAPGDRVFFYVSGHGTQAPIPVATKAAAMTKSCCPPMPTNGKAQWAWSKTPFRTMTCLLGRSPCGHVGCG